MKEKYDLVIVGAGPAGIMAAKTAGSGGLKVALIERKKNISRIHRSCGGVLNVNEPTFGEVVTFDEDKNELIFTNSGLKIKYDGPHQDIFGFSIYSPNGLKLEFGSCAQLRKDPMKNRLGLSVSKEQLLQQLLEETEDSEVSIFPNTNVCSVKKELSSVLVETDEGTTFESTLVIAADGINSRIARILGLNKSRSFYGSSRTATLEIEGTSCPEPEAFIFVITPRCIASMIPIAQKNCYDVSVSTYRRDEKPLELINYFMREDPVYRHWFKNSRVLEHKTACVVNLMNPMEKPYKDQVLFIGDACWRREMSNVGSICTGWKAGEIIIEALKNGNPNEKGMQPYLDWYQENYYGPEGKRKQGGRDFTDYLDPEDIDYLVGLPEVQFPQTMDIFKVINYIGKTYSELMTQINEERPNVMNNLVMIRENMEEDMQKRISWGFRNV